MKASPTVKKEVLALLQQLGQTYAARSATGFLECFAKDKDVLALGTGADERCLGQKEILRQLERDWAQFEAASFKLVQPIVSAAGAVAWAAATCRFTFTTKGQSSSMDGRATFVLEKRQGRWCIVQAHFSSPPDA